MNLASLHTAEKPVSVVKLSTENFSSAIAIQLEDNAVLDKHTTKTPALLVCVTGKTVYETEKGEKHILSPGDYVNIEPTVMHWLTAEVQSHLLLLK